MKNYYYLGLISILLCCGTKPQENNNENKDSISKLITDTVANAAKDTNAVVSALPKNDSLDEMAKIISGIKDENAKVLSQVFKKKAFINYSNLFETSWKKFDSLRAPQVENFRSKKLNPIVGKTNTLFYPFSGPDFLYANSFFPDADRYIMMGLEPVGTLPFIDQKNMLNDSMGNYFFEVKQSLNSIMSSSFFKTISMHSDFRHRQLDGTLHVLLLFIKRTGHDICSIKPGSIDTAGIWQYQSSFPAMAKNNLNNKGIEIKFTDKTGRLKTLYFFSLNLQDDALKNNRNLNNYFAKLGEVNTYLKGASYLMHRNDFSRVRNVIFEHSNFIMQDDSGIAMAFFKNSGFQWDFSLFGKYTRPIPLFASRYQPELDSMWKSKGSTPLGFGLGYNSYDNNSNLLVAKKTGKK
ncbi:MAG: hypothetical protein ACK5D5_10225 [Bacteroidota bacterium]|jgi:hypothetical protein